MARSDYSASLANEKLGDIKLELGKKLEPLKKVEAELKNALATTAVDMEENSREILDFAKKVVYQMQSTKNFAFPVTVDGQEVTKETFKNKTNDAGNSLKIWGEVILQKLDAYKEASNAVNTTLESYLESNINPLIDQMKVSQQEAVDGAITAVCDTINVVNWALTFGVLGTAAGAAQGGNISFEQSISDQMTGSTDPTQAHFSDGSAITSQVNGEIYTTTFDSFQGPLFDTAASSQWANQATQYPLFAAEGILLEKASSKVQKSLKSLMFGDAGKISSQALKDNMKNMALEASNDLIELHENAPKASSARRLSSAQDSILDGMSEFDL